MLPAISIIAFSAVAESTYELLKINTPAKTFINLSLNHSLASTVVAVV